MTRPRKVDRLVSIASVHRGELILQYYTYHIQLGYLAKTGDVAYENNGRWWLSVGGRHVDAKRIEHDIKFTSVACDIPFLDYASRGFGPGAVILMPDEIKDKLPVLEGALKEYLNSLQQTNSSGNHGTESKNQVDQHGPEQAR